MSYEDLRYNEVRQKSSHNSFQKQEGIYDQVVYWRIRSLEIDLHRGKEGREELSRDWYVYHWTLDPETTVDRFSGFLELCRGIQRAIPKHEVITVFIDIKDDFHKTPSASQSGTALDKLVIDNLGEGHVYRPRDLLARKPGAGSLQEAVNDRKWPTLKELRGKFLFVLTGPTDKLAKYASSATANGRVCFLSNTVSNVSDVPGAGHIVFYNISGEKVHLAKKVCDAGLVARAYYIDNEGRWQSAIDNSCHHIATDKVNARVDSWSRIRRNTGFPFQCLLGYTPSITESGEVCGVWARSGDLWGERDSFFYHYRDCSNHLDNQYIFYISGPNSKVDDCVKGGVLARASLANNSAYFGVFRLGEKNGLRVQYRIQPGGSTIPEEIQLGPDKMFDADTLMYVKLKVSQGGRRTTGWGSIDGKDWTKLGSYRFDDPLKYQGFGVSSHGVDRGAKFLFGVPGNRARPAFNRKRFIGKSSDDGRGWFDWGKKRRWKVDRFAS
jgi:hypothetical protein